MRQCAVPGRGPLVSKHFGSVDGRRRHLGRTVAVVGVLSALAATIGAGAAAADPVPVAGASSAATASGTGSPAPDAQDAALTAEHEARTQGTATVVTDPATGGATFIGSRPGRPLTGASGDAGAAARSFVDHYGSLLGVADPGTELVESRRTAGEGGQTAVRYEQRTKGLPVVAGEVAVQVDGQGQVLSSTGGLSTATDVDTTAVVSAADASAAALTVASKRSGVSISTLSASTPSLEVYDPQLIGADGPNFVRTVWRTEVRTPMGDVDHLVLVDAQTKSIALDIDQRADAKNRSVCDNANNSNIGSACTTPVRTEGGPATGIADADNAYLYAGVTYDFYKNVLGRDSVDNKGLPLKSTVRFCPNPDSCPYANAFWNGSQMVYGDTYAGADDVVGHELTHGVTQYTSGLFYFGQSGAINESLSDVFGELADQSSTAGGGSDSAGNKWLMGEDLPIGAIRSMSNPPAKNDPDRMTSPIYYATAGDSRGVHHNSGVNNKAAFLMTDGATFNGKTVTGLGLTKVAHIYYTAQTTMIGPGTNYAELYNILQQSCANLVGQFGITAGDCTQVKNAVDATEMNLAPTAAGAAAAVPAVCPAGNPTPTNLFLDSMEFPGAGNWSASVLAGSGLPSTGLWQYSVKYPRSPRLALNSGDYGGVSDTAARTVAPISVPAGTTTYLRFNHAFSWDFDSQGSYDGGVLEYSVNGGTNWTDAGSLMTENGYNGTISSPFNASNPLFGRAAFVRNSPSYETTRLNLSSLAGQNVLIRFRVGTDDLADDYGWFIDDVRAYTCGPALPAGSRFHPVDPTRILDSRLGNGWSGQVAAGAPRELQVTGLGGANNVPANASAVVMNVTATGSSAGSFLTAWPAGVAKPNASNLNFGAGQTIPNLVTVKLGVGASAGRLAFATAVGSVDVIGDVVGYFDDGVGSGDLFTGVTPSRILDSRTANQPVTAGAAKDVQVKGVGGVPATATAVVANVTATGATNDSFLTAWPKGSAQPNASNLNFATGQTIPNLVTVKLGTDGKVSFANAVGSVHIVVDVVGYFDPTSGSKFHPITPTRMLDSRLGTGALAGPFTAGAPRALGVAGADASAVRADATAVVTNVTVTGGTANSFLTVYPDGVPAPNSSNLNFGVGQTIPNLVMVKIGNGGKIDLKNALGNVDVIADAVGFYSAT